MALTILLFIILSVLIFVSGKNLSVYGDIIAEHLGLGKALVGMILIASVTSLPELAVGISSVTIAQSADLALGDVMGSCAFNLLILALMDALIPKETLFSKASASHVMAGAMSIILIGLVGLGIFLPQEITVTQWIGLGSLMFLSVYFLSMRIIYLYEEKLSFQKKKEQDPVSVPNTSLKKASLLYSINALIVIGAALFLPGITEEIAHKTGIGTSFAATLFLAAATSFPEVAVSLGAVRLGSYDLAIGNLLGSNLFNMLVLFIDDLFYTKGFLLKDASENNLISVLSVIIMTAIAIGGLTYRVPKKRFLLAWDALLICLMYITNLLLLYYTRLQ